MKKEEGVLLSGEKEIRQSISGFFGDMTFLGERIFLPFSKLMGVFMGEAFAAARDLRRENHEKRKKEERRKEDKEKERKRQRKRQRKRRRRERRHLTFTKRS